MKNSRNYYKRTLGILKSKKFILIEQLLKLKQIKVGKAAIYIIEFRRLSGRIDWLDIILQDLIRRGLLPEIRKEYDKIEKKPDTLFETTNLIIDVDKKYYLKNNLVNSENFFQKNRKSLNEHILFKIILQMKWINLKV